MSMDGLDLISTPYFFFQRPKSEVTNLFGQEKRNERSGEQEISGMKGGRTLKRISRGRINTNLDYDLMIAIIPWIGNVLMPLAFSERNVCEGTCLCPSSNTLCSNLLDIFHFCSFSLNRQCH